MSSSSCRPFGSGSFDQHMGGARMGSFYRAEAGCEKSDCQESQIQPETLGIFEHVVHEIDEMSLKRKLSLSSPQISI